MSEQTFRIGETALVRPDVSHVTPGMEMYLGETVVIEGPLRFVSGWRAPLYVVRCLSDHSLFLASSWALKKLPPPPPSTDMLDTATPLKRTRWSDSPWKPQGVKA